MKLAWGIRDYSQLGGLVDYGWGMAREDRAFVFVDNHDNQRGHGGAGTLTSRLHLTMPLKAAFTLVTIIWFSELRCFHFVYSAMDRNTIRYQLE